MSAEVEQAFEAAVPSTQRTVTLAALGLAAGFASGFLGIGGGLVVVPGLMIALQYPIKRAVGISVVTVVLLSAVGIVTELVVTDGSIRWGAVGVLTLGSIVGTVVGGRLLRRLPDSPLRWLFAGALFVAATRMALSVCGVDPLGELALSSTSAHGTVVVLAVGVVAGVTSTLFGLGGGIVTVPCLSHFFGDFGFQAARATSLATIFPTSLLAAYQHERTGTVDRSVVRALLPTGLVGAVGGVLAANSLETANTRLVFALFLAAAAVRVLMLRPRPAEKPAQGAVSSSPSRRIDRNARPVSSPGRAIGTSTRRYPLTSTSS